MSQADNLELWAWPCHFLGTSLRNGMWLRWALSHVRACFHWCRWAVALCMPSKLRWKGCHVFSLCRMCTAGSQVPRLRGRAPPNQCVAKNMETVTLSQTWKGTLDGSRAINEINGILKLNGDCPCQNEKPKNAHVSFWVCGGKRTDFLCHRLLLFSNYKKGFLEKWYLRIRSI